jgi:hypothetical protein
VILSGDTPSGAFASELSFGLLVFLLISENQNQAVAVGDLLPAVLDILTVDRYLHSQAWLYTALRATWAVRQTGRLRGYSKPSDKQPLRCVP